MKKKNIFVIAFWLLIIFIIYSTLMIMKMNAYKFDIFGLNSPLKPISVNFELEEKYRPEAFLLCFNDYCKTPQADFFYNVYSFSFDKTQEGFFNTKVKNVFLAYPYDFKDFKKNIKALDVHIGADNYYYDNKDILSFSEKSFSVELQNGDKRNYSAIVLPEINNYKGILKHLVILYCALIYNFNYFLVPYFWLIVACLIYIFKKNEFNFKLNKKALFFILPIIFLMIFIPIAAYLIRDNGTNNFINFVKKDSIKYQDEYEIYAISSLKDSKEDKIQWHYTDKNSIKSIKKDDYTKNKKAVIYFNSNEVDVDKASPFNPKGFIYKTNSSLNAKLIYD